MAMYTSGKSKNQPMSDINVTPMVDVMLVLLVIFIMAAPLLTHSVNVNLPSEKAQTAQVDQKPIVLSINANGQYFIGENTVKDEDLVNALSQLAQTNKDTPIHIRADQTIPYAKVARLLAASQQAGLSKVSFLTQSGSAASSLAKPAAQSSR